MKDLRIADADQNKAFLGTREGYDVASLHRYAPADLSDTEHHKHLLTDDEWQLLINQVDAAPSMVSLITEFLCDQETLEEPFRNEAICEKARALLTKINELYH